MANKRYVVGFYFDPIEIKVTAKNIREAKKLAKVKLATKNPVKFMVDSDTEVEAEWRL